MRLITLVAMIALGGCAAIPIEHRDDNSMNAKEAAAAVDRALMTQPPQFRPESIDVTDEYVMYGKGTVTRGRNSLLVVPIGNAIAVGGGRSRSTSKALIERIYFDSLSSIRLFKKKRLFIVQVRSNDRQPVKQFYIYNEEQAHALINGLRSLQRLNMVRPKSEEY